MLPNYLIIGAQKSGTSSLNYYLGEHPEIFAAERELHCFDVDEDDYVQRLKDYTKTFSGINKSIVGECTPCYLFSKKAPKRIFNELPNCKLIIIFRDPVFRAYSHYWKNIKNGRERLSFEEALEAEPERLAKSSYNYFNYSYRTRGIYSEQVNRFLEYFSKDEILFLKFDDFKDRTEGELERVYNFLGVEPIDKHSRLGEVKNQAQNSRSKFIFKISRPSTYNPFMRKVLKRARVFKLLRYLNMTFNTYNFEYPQIRKSTEYELRGFYKTHNEYLEKITGLDLSEWNKFENYN